MRVPCVRFAEDRFDLARFRGEAVGERYELRVALFDLGTFR